MALPTTNLTLHVDASANTDLWQSANPFATNPTDGQVVNYWDSVEHGTNILKFATAGVWRSTTPLMANPCIDLNGTTENYVGVLRSDAATAVTLGELIGGADFTIFFAIYPEGITTNLANVYDNDCLITDIGGALIGIHLKDAADPHVLFTTYDGNWDVVTLPITLNASHVLMMRKETTTLFGSVDNGTESSVAAGNAGFSAFQSAFGREWNNAAHFNGRIGEIAIYDAALTGTPFTDAMGYFTAKWLTSAETEWWHF